MFVDCPNWHLEIDHSVFGHLWWW